MTPNTVNQSNEPSSRRMNEWYENSILIYNSWEFFKADEHGKKPQIPKHKKCTKPTQQLAMKSNKTRIKFTGTPGNVLNSLKHHRSERGDAQSKREGTYVYLCPIHVDTQQKLTQYCEAIILRLKNFLKSAMRNSFCFCLAAACPTLPNCI